MRFGLSSSVNIDRPRFTSPGADSIEGTSDGTVRYDCDGEGRSAFLKNRIGFCVLHPIRECAGARARQSRTGGAVIEGELPRAIEPQIFGQASFQDLRRLAHEIEPGCWAELAFEGEVFEMEDQRNWTDASFKTYCTPLARPFPVEFKPGERVRQSVTLRLIEDSSASGTVARSGPEEERVTIEWRDDGKSGRMPELGLGLASDDEPLTELETERLRALRLDHVRHDARLARGSWVPELERALEQCGRLGVALELAVHLPQAGAARASGVARAVGAVVRGNFRPAHGSGGASEDQADSGAARRGGGHDPGIDRVGSRVFGRFGGVVRGGQRPQFL